MDRGPARPVPSTRRSYGPRHPRSEKHGADQGQVTRSRIAPAVDSASARPRLRRSGRGSCSTRCPRGSLSLGTRPRGVGCREGGGGLARGGGRARCARCSAAFLTISAWKLSIASTNSQNAALCPAREATAAPVLKVGRAERREGTNAFAEACGATSQKAQKRLARLTRRSGPVAGPASRPANNNNHINQPNNIDN